ncbi:MAG: arginine--tRNA ligase [Flavobacteriales bacterium]|nr:arginine--tRNA ligase [Flavobacteriales bacterium]
MQDIVEQIQQTLSKAFLDLYDTEIAADTLKLERTRKEYPGDFTFVVFPFLRTSKKKPEETAGDLGRFLVEAGAIRTYNVVKGFLNLEVDTRLWIEFLNQTGMNLDAFGKRSQNGEKVMVEYSSPNTNKPLHLGHIRNNLLGFAVSNILRFTGHEVVRTNLVNDRGIHICKSMLAWMRLGNGSTPTSEGMKGDHFVGHYYVLFDKEYRAELNRLKENGMDEKEAEAHSEWMEGARELLRKWEANDAAVRALWKQMNDWVYAGFDSTYRRLGVDFDRFYYESDTYLLGRDLVMEGLEKGVFFRKDDGSVWADLTEFGLDEKLLLRSDGTSVYITQDLGTAQLKYDDYGMDRSVYVVGNEQDYHFKVLQLLLEKLEKPYAGGIYHLSYGMVDLPHGKMKSREGTVVDADDLMNEMHATARARTEEQGKTEGLSEQELDQLYETIGLGALKYFLLRVDAGKRMLFNPEESIDLQGNTATFIQYTYARCRSILRSVEFVRSEIGSTDPDPLENALILHIYAFPHKVMEAAESLNPSVLCNYTYELAKLYNAFYNQLHILREEDPAKRALRLNLTHIVSELVRKNLNLLGISVPERM